MICYAKSFSIKSPWILEGLLIKKVHAVLIYILCQHKQPPCKHTAVSTMSNNSVSIRSPLSCVRGLHANRCPGLTLTSYSWLSAIKSINENINTNFSASPSPYVRAAHRHRFPSGLCEWTGCSEPARSGSPQFVYWTACAERDTLGMGAAGGETNHGAAWLTQRARPRPRATGFWWRLEEGEEMSINRGTDLRTCERQAALKPSTVRFFLSIAWLCWSIASLRCNVARRFVIVNTACGDIGRSENVRAPCAPET